MGEKLLSESTVRGMVRAKLQGRTMRAVAKEIGIAPSYLTAVMAGTKTLGEKIPAHFDLEPVTLYAWARRPKSEWDEPARGPALPQLPYVDRRRDRGDD